MATKQGATAAILCNSRIVREAIAVSLDHHGIDCVPQGQDVDVAIIVPGMLMIGYQDEVHKSSCPLDEVNAEKWIIMGGNESDPLFIKLQIQGYNPCIIPADVDADDLGHIVSLAVAGHTVFIDHSYKDSCAEYHNKLIHADLDESQKLLLEHLALGLSNKEIAIIQKTTESSIKARLRVLLQKLDLSNRTKAAVLAAKCGFGNKLLTQSDS